MYQFAAHMAKEFFLAFADAPFLLLYFLPWVSSYLPQLKIAGPKISYIFPFFSPSLFVTGKPA